MSYDDPARSVAIVPSQIEAGISDISSPRGVALVLDRGEAEQLIIVLGREEAKRLT